LKFPIYFGTYEEEEANKILRNVKRGMMVLDTGANIGY
jgi:hypothetical protein